MKSSIFLTNTDTTIGFISKDKKSLDKAKNRIDGKEYITALSSLKHLKKRVPKKFKKIVRRAKKTTFILNKNYSFRIIQDDNHNLLINRLNFAFTTSANKSGKEFDIEYAIDKSDIIIYPISNPKTPSKLYKINKKKIKRLR